MTGIGHFEAQSYREGRIKVQPANLRIACRTGRASLTLRLSVVGFRSAGLRRSVSGTTELKLTLRLEQIFESGDVQGRFKLAGAFLIVRFRVSNVGL